MLFILLATVTAFILRDSKGGEYLGEANENVVLTPYSAEALDLIPLDTDIGASSVVLSVGTRALSVEKKTRRIGFAPIEKDESSQFFKLILKPLRTYVIQHKDQCVGYSAFYDGADMENRAGRQPFTEILLVDCDDTEHVITFLKAEQLESEVRRKPVVTYVDDVPGYVDPHLYPNHDSGVLKPHEPGLLRGIYDRVSGLF